MAKKTVSQMRKAPRRTAPRAPRVDPAVGMPLSMLRGLHRFLAHLTSDEPEFDCRETERIQAKLARLIRGHEDEQVAEATRAPLDARIFRMEEALDRLTRQKSGTADVGQAPRLEAVR